MASYFFWSAGTPDQKSIKGLLRSLLYQLISSHPPFAEYVNREILFEGWDWSNKRLRAAIHTIVKKCPFEKVRLCLLIDGLDEFEGHESERESLIDAVEILLEGGYAKAVVSSRQESPFIDRFSKCRSLRLQDLTQRDIYAYAEGTLKDLMSRYGVSQCIS